MKDKIGTKDEISFVLNGKPLPKPQEGSPPPPPPKKPLPPLKPRRP